MRIDALDIDDHILDKIERKHGVRFEEVEEATNSNGGTSGERGAYTSSTDRPKPDGP